MDELRYPIGSFVPIHDPTTEQRDGWMEEMKQLPRNLRSAVQTLTEEQLNTEYRSGGWTVRQVIHHMADNDMNAYIRFKRGLTEDQPAASSYRQEAWAELSDYQDTPVEISLSLLEALHNRFVILLRSMQPHDFQKTFTSPAHGKMTLDFALQRYAWHGRHHFAQIKWLIARKGW